MSTGVRGGTFDRSRALRFYMSSRFSLGDIAAGFQSWVYRANIPAGSLFAMFQSKAAIGFQVPVNHPLLMLRLFPSLTILGFRGRYSI